MVIHDHMKVQEELKELSINDNEEIQDSSVTTANIQEKSNSTDSNQESQVQQEHNDDTSSFIGGWGSAGVLSVMKSAAQLRAEAKDSKSDEKPFIFYNYTTGERMDSGQPQNSTLQYITVWSS